MTTDRVVVVTGASSGIGEALARLLAREGFAVVLGARREERLQKLARDILTTGGEAVARRCDVTRREDAEALIALAVERYGHLDVLINNAGRGHVSSVEDTTDEVVRAMFEVNVFCLWHTIRPALRHMRRQGSGHIINNASLAGKLGFALNSAYVAAKHAVVGFTHALRLELAETGIHASVVCPFAVRTDWASSTEGGSMVPLFAEAGPLAAEIAAQRKIALPAFEGAVSPERVAERILQCIHSPEAEVFTHSGTREFALLAAGNREEAERRQLPSALAERRVYERLRRGSRRD